MKKFDGIVLCSDVDGTLIDEENKVPKENIEAIEYFRSQGGRFLIATGRVVEAVYPILDGLTLDFPCICHNGGSLFDFNEDRYIDTIELSKGAKEGIDEALAKEPSLGVEIMTDKGIYVLKQNHATKRHIEYEKITARYVDTPDEIDAKWIKILFAEEENVIDRLSCKMEGSSLFNKYSVMRTHNYYYEIFNKSAGKGNMLRRLCEMYKIDLKNLAVIGDNENDLSMLYIAGIKGVSGNAPENVKKQADIVTCTNCEGAVAEFISKL